MKCNELLDKTIDKIITGIMTEQSIEAARQEEKMDDMRRIISQRDDIINERLEKLMDYINARRYGKRWIRLITLITLRTH